MVLVAWFPIGAALCSFQKCTLSQVRKFHDITLDVARTSNFNHQPIKSWHPFLLRQCDTFIGNCTFNYTKARDRVMRLRYLCGCVTLMNRFNTKAVMWLLFCSYVRITNALPLCNFFSLNSCIDSNAIVAQM